MSKYTIELRYLIEKGIDIGLNDYPIYTPAYRQTLNNKIIHHFYFREIGFETPALFANRLREKMHLIMPYYNQLYESANLEFDPLTNYKSTETYDGKTTDSGVHEDHNHRDIIAHSETTSELHGTSDSGGKDSSNSQTKILDDQKLKTVESDTPQGLLSINNIEDETYASKAQLSRNIDERSDNTNSTVTRTSGTDSESLGHDQSQSGSDDTFDNESSHNNSGTNNYVKIVEGYNSVSPSELLEKYRSVLINIDQMIINELEPYFMGVW